MAMAISWLIAKYPLPQSRFWGGGATAITGATVGEAVLSGEPCGGIAGLLIRDSGSTVPKEQPGLNTTRICLVANHDGPPVVKSGSGEPFETCLAVRLPIVHNGLAAMLLDAASRPDVIASVGDSTSEDVRSFSV
jgi:hypothetical protein